MSARREAGCPAGSPACTGRLAPGNVDSHKIFVYVGTL